MKIVSYTDTAYDSRHPRALGPQTHDIGIAERQIRRYPIKSRGVHCREYLGATTASSHVEALKLISPDQRKAMVAEWDQTSIRMTWGTWKNPLVVVDAITKLAGYFAFFGGGMALLLGIPFNFDRTSLLLIGIFFVFPSIIYFLGKTIQKRGWVSNKNNTVLNRCTGMVSFIHKKKRIALPFDEFDPFLVPFTDPTGGTHYALNLMHRYSYKSVTQQHRYLETWQGELGWEMIQQFMDISQPLPDIPLWEISRIADPTTVEYDRRHQRPVDYWINQDPEQVRAWGQAARKAAKAYPWGKPRALALAEGWQPSGLGEGDWRGKPKPASPRQAKG